MEQKVIEDICCELSKDLLGLQFPEKLKVGNYYMSFSEVIVTELISQWVEDWLKKYGIDYALNDLTSDWLAIKSFTDSPNFDVAAFRSFINLVIEKPWKLHSKHLLIKYKMEDGVVRVEQF